MLKPISYAATALAFALAPLYLQPAHADTDHGGRYTQQHEHADPVVLSFSTGSYLDTQANSCSFDGCPCSS